MLEKQLKSLCEIAHEKLEPIGLVVTGLHYTSFRHPRKPGQCWAFCFDATTNNSNFFGNPYDNHQRQLLLSFLYEKLYDNVNSSNLGIVPYLDARVRLKPPYEHMGPAFEKQEISQGFVDTTKDHQVTIVMLEDVLASGELVRGGVLEQSCNKYNLGYVLKHGRHFISPDPGVAEAFQAIAKTHQINSVLELGGGVGTSGVVAMKNGINDFTFVDISPEVCAHLRRQFPEYDTVQADAFEFDFSQHWDVLLVGIPYSLQPWLLASKGSQIRESCDVAVFQSGCPAFYEFEHAWIAGNNDHSTWPWWNPEQTVPYHFPYSFESALYYQACVIAGNKPLPDIRINLEEVGFSDIEYTYYEQ